MIHPKAIVSHCSVVATTVRVWQFASVIRGSIIGAESSVGGCAIVDAARIGCRCSIGHGAQVHPGTRIGDDVFVGPGAIICNDRWPRVDKEGFDSSKLLNGTVVTVIVEDGASIGAGAIILPGVRVGAGAMVAAGAVAERKVPANALLKRSGELVLIELRDIRRMRAA